MDVDTNETWVKYGIMGTKKITNKMEGVGDISRSKRGRERKNEKKEGKSHGR